MVKMIKEAVPNDVFLGQLHTLMLMDDTVILATTREACLKKLTAVLNYCEEYGMEINVKKTKFFVINPQKDDKIPMHTRNKTIDYCKQYMYLGSWFTDDGKIKSALKLHEPSHQSSMNKFAIFCRANAEMPYYYKSTVMDAAVTSSILYGCETWFCKKPQKVISTYNQLLKCLLGVRLNTSINLCLVESGKHPARFIIRH